MSDQLARDYAEVFGTPAAERVLYDLQVFAGKAEPMVRAGRHDVIGRIYLLRSPAGPEPPTVKTDTTKEPK